MCGFTCIWIGQIEWNSGNRPAFCANLKTPSQNWVCYSRAMSCNSCSQVSSWARPNVNVHAPRYWHWQCPQLSKPQVLKVVEERCHAVDSEVEVKGGAFVQQIKWPFFLYQMQQSCFATKWYYGCDSSGPIHRSTDTRHGGMTASGFLWTQHLLHSCCRLDCFDISWSWSSLIRSWHCPLAAWLFSMMSFVCGLLASTPCRRPDVSKRQQYWKTL